jgi:hypothetical protein
VSAVALVLPHRRKSLRVAALGYDAVHGANAALQRMP